MNKCAPYPILRREDFKAWSLMYPNARLLLKEIIFRWRGANISVPGRPGKWAVYPRSTWAEWSGLTFEQFKDASAVLKRDGLIRSERHRFGGVPVLAFISPTKLAIDYLGRPQDIGRLGEASDHEAAAPQSPFGPSGKAPIGAPPPAPAETSSQAPTLAPTPAPAGAPGDYTSFPFLPSSSSSSSVLQKGKAGGGGKNSNKPYGSKYEQIDLQKSSNKAKSCPQLSPTPDISSESSDEEDAKFDAMLAASKVKALEHDLKLFPRLKGPHAIKVKHPSDVDPKKWPSLSWELKAKFYEHYVKYVENWNKAHTLAKTKISGTSGSELSLKKYINEPDPEMAELNAKFDAAMAKMSAQPE